MREEHNNDYIKAIFIFEIKYEHDMIKQKIKHDFFYIIVDCEWRIKAAIFQTAYWKVVLGKVILSVKKGVFPLSRDISMFRPSKKLKITFFEVFNLTMSSKILKKFFFLVYFFKTKILIPTAPQSNDSVWRY